MPAPDLEVYLNSAYSPSSIAADLANPHVTIIVACNDIDSVVGFVQLTEGTMEDCLKGTEKPVELQRLYVSQEYHGEGVGRKLVDCVERLALERGFVTMWLGVVSITSLCFYALQTLSLCLMVLALVFDNNHVLICRQWEENFKAQKVYERIGFRKVGQHDFKMGNCVQTDWILTKRL
jgi:ribosomal protein S18 acetylase RimI-like enzyme